MTASDRRTETARARPASGARKPHESAPDGHEGPDGNDNPDIPDDPDDRE